MFWIKCILAFILWLAVVSTFLHLFGLSNERGFERTLKNSDDEERKAA